MDTEDLEAGTNARRLRKQSGLTLQDVAGRAGLDPTKLSMLERGGRKWTIHTLKAVSRALGVLVGDLVDWGEGEDEDEDTAAA